MSVPELPKKQAPAQSEAVSDLAAMMRPSKFTDQTADAKLDAVPNKPFLLRHHPAAWQVSSTLPEQTLLPEVCMHVLEPGVNGVRTLSKGEKDKPWRAYEDSVWKAERNGWVYLSALQPVPADCLPAGVTSGGYLRDVDCADPRTGRSGIRYLEAWMIPVATLPGEAQEFKFDRASYEKWLLWLVESGLIAAPMAQIGQRLSARARGHLERAQIANLAPEIRKMRIDAKQAIVTQYEAAAGNPPAEQADAAPKKKRGRARK